MTINCYVKCHPDLFKPFFTVLHLLCVCVCVHNGWCEATRGLAQQYVWGEKCNEAQTKPTREG